MFLVVALMSECIADGLGWMEWTQSNAIVSGEKKVLSNQIQHDI